MTIRATKNSQKQKIVKKKKISEKKIRQKKIVGTKVFSWSIKKRLGRNFGIILSLQIFTNFLFHKKTRQTRVLGAVYYALYCTCSQWKATFELSLTENFSLIN